MTNSMRFWRYGLWSLTLFVVAWAISLVSALVAGKGIDKMRVSVDGTVPGLAPGFDSGAGEL